MFYIAAIMAYFYIALLLRELNIIKKRERVKYHTGEIKMPPKEGDELSQLLLSDKKKRKHSLHILYGDSFRSRFF